MNFRKERFCARCNKDEATYLLHLSGKDNQAHLTAWCAENEFSVELYIKLSAAFEYFLLRCEEFPNGD